MFGQNTRYTNDGNLIRDLSGMNNHLKPSGMGGDLTIQNDSIDRLEGSFIRGTPATLNAEKMFISSVSQGHPLSMVQTHSCTVAFRLFYTDDFSNANDFPRIIDKSTGPNAADGWGIWFDSTAVGANKIIVGMEGSTFALIPTGTYINAWRTYFVRINPHNAPGTCDLYMSADNANIRDQVGFVSSNSSNATFTSNTADLNVFNSPTLSRPFEGRMPWLMVWNRGLTRNEMHEIARQPFQIFNAPKPWYLYNRRIDIEPTGYADPDLFGAATVTVEQTLSPTGYADPDLFGAATVTIAQTLTPTGYADPDLFGAARVDYTLSLAGYADPDLFGSAAVTLGDILTATGYADPDLFGAAAVAQYFFYGFVGPTKLVE
jgi:hypothetical protein